MEILTDFVRREALVSANRLTEWKKWLDAGADLRALPDDSSRENDRVRPDIQAILTVLARREQTAERQEPNPLDLRSTDLRFASWNDAYLPRANFIQSDLERAFLVNANLNRALFGSSILRNTVFSGASFRDAWMQSCFAVEAAFYGADFTRVNVNGSQFHRAHFDEAILNGLSFSNCNLTETSFTEAKMQRVSFHKTILVGADFADADLTKADLRGLDLSRCRGLTADQIAAAFTNEKTKLPPSL